VDGEAVIGEYPHLLQGGGFEGGVDYLYAGKVRKTKPLRLTKPNETCEAY
jgi:hypothetical protein